MKKKKQYITSLADIKSHLETEHKELVSIKRETIRRKLKKLLHYSYRKVSTRGLPVLTKDHMLLRKHFAKFLLLGKEAGLVFVFIDEYSMNETAVKPYNWAKIDEVAYVVVPHRNPSHGQIACIWEQGLLFLH